MALRAQRPPSLTWGAADDRARLWRSPTYALRVDTKAAETPPEPCERVWGGGPRILRPAVHASTVHDGSQLTGARGERRGRRRRRRHEGFCLLFKNCTEHEAEDYRSGDPAESVGAELARRAVSSLAGPPDVVVNMMAARP